MKAHQRAGESLCQGAAPAMQRREGAGQAAGHHSAALTAAYPLCSCKPVVLQRRKLCLIAA